MKSYIKLCQQVFLLGFCLISIFDQSALANEILRCNPWLKPHLTSYRGFSDLEPIIARSEQDKLVLVHSLIDGHLKVRDLKSFKIVSIIPLLGFKLDSIQQIRFSRAEKLVVISMHGGANISVDIQKEAAKIRNIQVPPHSDNRLTIELDASKILLSSNVLAISKDGKKLAGTSIGNKEVGLYQLSNGKKWAGIPLGSSMVQRIIATSFSIDSRTIAFALNNPAEILTYDISQESPVRTARLLVKNNSLISSVAVDSYTNSVLIGYQNGEVQIVRNAGQDFRTVHYPAPTNSTQITTNKSFVNSLTFSPNGELFALGIQDGFTGIYVTKTLEPFTEKPVYFESGIQNLSKMQSRQLFSVAFSFSGKYFASVSVAGILRRFDIESDIKLPKVNLGTSVTAVAFSRDDRLIAVALEGGKVQIHDNLTGQFLIDLNGNDQNVSAISFSQDMSKLFVKTQDSPFVYTYQLFHMDNIF